MLFYQMIMRTIAAVLALTVILGLLAGCGRDASLSSVEEEGEPAAGRKAASSPASVISVLGVRG